MPILPPAPCSSPSLEPRSGSRGTKCRSVPFEGATHLHVQPLPPLPRVLNQQLQRVFAAPSRLSRPQPVDLGANVLLYARVDEVPRLHALSAESAWR